MPVRRSWPPTDRRLLYAILVVYGTTLALVAAFSGELAWAVKALDGYLRTDDYPPTEDRLLIGEAMLYATEHEGDLEGLAALLERAVEIDPNGQGLFLLAGLEASKGDDDKALALYEKYRSIDPYNIQVYAAMISIFERKGDRESAERLLADGVERFRVHVELHEPHPDHAAAEDFNRKAVGIHEAARQQLVQLEQALARVREAP